jgi:hypothetical protein
VAKTNFLVDLVEFRPQNMNVFMHNKKNLYYFLIAILIIYTLSRRKNINDGSKKISSNYDPSSKQQMAEGTIGINEEFLDSIKNIYSNYTYSISVDLPDHWRSDGGVSKHTIFRSYNVDSAITFSINVIKQPMENNFNLWDFFDKHHLEYKTIIENEIKTQANVNLNALIFKKIYLKNYKTIRTYYENSDSQRDLTLEMSTIQYQVFRNNFIYTISLIMPKELYNKNPEYYEGNFDRVNFLIIQ